MSSARIHHLDNEQIRCLSDLPADLQDAMSVQYSPHPALPARFVSHDVTDLLRNLAKLAGPQRVPNLTYYTDLIRAGGGTIGCGNFECPNREKSVSVSQCARCRTARYCNVTCQRADWGRHKLNCKALATEADRLDSGGSAAAEKAREGDRNSYRAARLVSTLRSELALAYAAWSVRFGSMPGVVIVDTPDLAAWNGGVREDASMLELPRLGAAPGAAESAVAFLTFLPLNQAFFYRREYVAGNTVPHGVVYPPCHGPDAQHVPRAACMQRSSARSTTSTPASLRCSSAGA